MDKQSKRIIKTISLKAIVVSLLFLVSLGVFALLAHEIVFENEDWIDSRAFLFFKSHSSPAMIKFFKILTFFGSPMFLFPAYVILIVWLLIKKRRADAIDIGIIAITSTVLVHSLKALIGRSRPDLPLFKALTNASFPSGHALSSFIFCSLLIWLIWRTEWNRAWKWVLSSLLILFSLAIGVSRIVLRYHYASDVLAGFCMGFAWVLLSLWLQQKFRNKNGLVWPQRATKNPDSYREGTMK